MNVSPSRIPVLSLALVAFLGVGADQQCTPPDPAAAGPAVLYELTSASSFFEGCLLPCTCPSPLPQSLEGTMVLTLLEAEEGSPFDVYEVSDVDWTYPFFGDVVSITGSGTYQLGVGPDPIQRLELDLAIGADPVEHFDSGLVPGGDLFPGIEITISINGLVCFDTVLVVAAEPAV